MLFMVIYIMYKTMIYKSVPVITLRNFFIAVGCVSALCQPIPVFIAAKKYMRNTAVSICRTKLLPILNVCCD